MNDNDKWLIINTDSLKKAYSPIQSGDEIYDPPQHWRPCRSIGASMTDYDNGFRRLRSKAWLKASEHPIVGPAWIIYPGHETPSYHIPDCFTKDGNALWQPAPPLPEPPAKEDACEKAFERAVATFDHDAVMGKYGRYEWAAWQAFFKAGWEARGEK